MPAGRRLFVYYRVPVAELSTSVACARALQAALRADHPALDAGLWRRPEPRDGAVTLMETYASRDGIDPTLADTIERRAADAGLPQPRHVEVFEPLA